MSIKRALINTAAAGDTQLVAAPGLGQVIRVVNFVLIASGGVTVKFASGPNGATTLDLTGPMALSAGQGLWPGWTGDDFHGRACHFEAEAGKALQLNLGGAIQVSGYLNYWLAPDC